MSVEQILQSVNSLSILLIPLIVAITQLIKGFIPEKHRSNVSPLISLALGVALSVLINKPSGNSVIAGIVIGLSAAGLWSAGRTPGKIINTIKSNDQ